MTTAIEIINGSKYQVTRDDDGNIVLQVGADDPMQDRSEPIRDAARLLLDKDPDTWTLRDMARVLRFILRRLLD